MKIANPNDQPCPSPVAATFLELDRIHQWNVFKRLQELSIPCECAWGQPLRVTVATPAAAIQTWSVVQHCTAPTANLAQHLDRCLQQRIKR
ncbi:MAG: Asr1405/Asl0597 family protein [Nodosilinea sp.]